MSYSKDNGQIVHIARSGSIDDACQRYGIARGARAAGCDTGDWISQELVA